MNTISEYLEEHIYSYLSIHDIKFINSKNYKLYLNKLKKSKIIIRKNISNYLYEFKILYDDEHTLYNKIVWKKFYPLCYRIPMIKLSLTKIYLTQDQELIINNIINSNNTLVNKFNKFIDLLDIEQINIIGW